MNLGSEAYSTEYVLNTFEYDLSGSAARVPGALEDKEETYDLQALFCPLTHAVLQLKNPSLPKAEIGKTGVGTWGGVHIYIYYIYTGRLNVPCFVLLLRRLTSAALRFQHAREKLDHKKTFTPIWMRC